MASGELLTDELLQKTNFLGLRLWVLICLSVGVFILLILASIVVWALCGRKKSGRKWDSPLISYRIPAKSREIPVDQVVGAQNLCENRGSFADKATHEQVQPNERRILAYMVRNTSAEEEILSQSGSVCPSDRCGSSYSGEEAGDSRPGRRSGSSCATAVVSSSPLVGLPEFSHLGWGHWFTLRDLDSATNHFSQENILGEGGYGVVYRGRLVNGTQVAVKRLLNNMGQAEKEFRVEVEAIGHVRHKNLVRLLGYCVEGVQRMLVYEYVSNGNLEQWLHGRGSGVLSWESRIKVLMGTAKALSYLHEAVEPKVVHRDVKSSNILINDEFEAKVSDFGLAKLLGSGKSHIATRVMGTFGYVAPEYANTGLLNEKSDVYSFGVLLLEAVSGRDPVDYCRPANEVNLVEWIKVMVGSRRMEEVVDPNLEPRPTTRALKRALLIALKCVDPGSDRRPKMGQVVRMLEVDKFPQREDRRRHSSLMGSMDLQSPKDGPNSAELDKV